MKDEFRVEVELDHAEHGYSFGERLRALDLDDEARKRLGQGVVVTRDGSRLFLYADSDAQAREAERVVGELVGADRLSADIAVKRWHPIAEEWIDASLPIPRTPEEEEAEYAAREAAEAKEAVIEGEYDWHVVVHLSARDEAAELAARLKREGVPTTHRWRYAIAHALTEEQADELAERIRADLPDDADVRIEVDLSDVTRSPLQFLPF